MADRIVVMDRGRIQQVGAPLELYDRPANKFVAGFLGSPSMSFVSGALKATPEKSWFESAGGGRLALAGKAAPAGNAVEAGIRPEHFIIGEAADAMYAAVATPETTLVAFSVSGYARSVIEAVQVAQQYGATTVAITAPDSALAKAADTVIHLQPLEDGNIYKPTSSRYALLAIVDMRSSGSKHQRCYRGENELPDEEQDQEQDDRRDVDAAKVRHDYTSQH